MDRTIRVAISLKEKYDIVASHEVTVPATTEPARVAILIEDILVSMLRQAELSKEPEGESPVARLDE